LKIKVIEQKFSGEFHKKDNQKFFPINLNIPEGTQKLKLKFTYFPEYMKNKKQAVEDINNKLNDFYKKNVIKLDSEMREIFKEKKKTLIKELIPLKNQLNFSLYSPLGKFRGRWDSPHFYGKKIAIDSKCQEDTTTGFLCGPITGGNWTVEIETHGICSEKVSYELEIWFYKKEIEYKWYKGELHLHTNHSDGKTDLKNMVELVKDYNLDYFALSDHNTISAWNEITNEMTDDITIIPSIELSSYFGHAVALNINSYIDWRTTDKNDNLEKQIRQIHNQGGLFSVAHPFSIGNPVCMGCEWEYSEIDWKQIDLLEVWFRNWEYNIIQNTLARKLWHRKLDEKYKITIISSNDLHDPQFYKNNKRIPFTYVKAEECTKEHISYALSRGKAYISSGPEVDFKAALNDNIIGEMGDVIKFNSEIKLRFSVKKLTNKVEANLYHDGEIVYTKNLKKSKDNMIYYNISKVGYYYWEIKAENSKEILVLTNPIFIKQ